MVDIEQMMELPSTVSPVNLARYFGSHSLYKWQKDVMTDVFEPTSQVALCTANGVGKTQDIVANTGLAWMSAYPAGQVVSTAGVSRQIKDQLWPVLRSKLAPYPRWTVKAGLEIVAPSVNGMAPATWKAFTAEDAELAEGFHGRNVPDKNHKVSYAPLLWIVDEAKSVKDDIIEAVFRCQPDALLVCSSPGEDTGFFFDIFNKNKGNWKQHTVTAYDCPHLCTGANLKKMERVISEFGIDHPFVRSTVFAEFSRSGEDFVFNNMRYVEEAFSGTTPRHGHDKRAACDISGGGDEQVFMVRMGNHALPPVVFHERNATVLARLFINEFERHSLLPEWITIDEGGAGGAVIDIIEQTGWAGIHRFDFAAKAYNQKRFCTRATEIAFDIRAQIEQGLISLDPDDKLRSQMRTRRFTRTNNDDGRIRHEPKKKMRSRGEDSPDRLDTVIMLYEDMPTYQTASNPATGGPADQFITQENDSETAYAGDIRGWFDE